MCGRYTLATPDPSQLRARLPLGERIEVRRRYNVAPGDDVLAVVRPRDGASREGTLLRWGLVPYWASDPKEVGVKTINARAETVAERPAYRDAFARRRCLIVADGFYEWSARHAALDHARGRRAVRVRRAVGVVAPARRRRRRAAAHAARSSRPRPPDRSRDLHDRMPVILDPADEAAGWTRRRRPTSCTRCSPPPARRAAGRPVSRNVNDARHDAPDCLDPPEQASLF